MGNRSLLIDAASAELSEHGLDVSIARIAARAGVAKGTVFNHFSSKEELISAIFCDQLDTLAATGETLLEHTDPRAALLQFMSAGAELQANDRAFCEAAAATSRAHPAIRAASDRLAQVAEALTARARQAGVVRADVTGHDIVLLLNAPTRIAAPLAGARSDLWRRYLHLIFDALRPEAGHELPVAAPTNADFTTAATR
ncbi:TetR family transcriptional regulator [Microtetraspora sp. NBRC 13810]|uniref:TetR/AcrR family transcriptional regulator n=1 Tax=Microtetraspora sp. NBRC 13810 TaxID=3030990 RepID=UPI0024A42643|nr:TetR/AcrR family transcriptional regulator [Microtetraspora sp. NBRC 13810]GLW11416.1 TetR family transcriptional regulator [Microtetraspora sp. NBRC 13810]